MSAPILPQIGSNDNSNSAHSLINATTIQNTAATTEEKPVTAATSTTVPGASAPKSESLPLTSIPPTAVSANPTSSAPTSSTGAAVSTAGESEAAAAAAPSHPPFPADRVAVKFLVPSVITGARAFPRSVSAFDDRDQINPEEEGSQSASTTPTRGKAKDSKKSTTTKGKKGKTTTSKSNGVSSSPTNSVSSSPTNTTPLIPGLGILTNPSTSIKKVTVFGYPSQSTSTPPVQVFESSITAPASESNSSSSTAASPSSNTPAAAAASATTTVAGAPTNAQNRPATATTSATTAPTSSSSAALAHLPFAKRMWHSTGLKQLFSPLQLYSFIHENDKQEYTDRVRISQMRREEAKRAEAAIRAGQEPPPPSNTSLTASTSFMPMWDKLREQHLSISLRYTVPTFNTVFRGGSALETFMHTSAVALTAYEANCKKEQQAHTLATRHARESYERMSKNAINTTPVRFPPPLILPPPPPEYKVSLNLHLYQQGFSLNGGVEGDKNFHLYSKQNAEFLRAIDHGEQPAMLAAMVAQLQTNNPPSSTTTPPSPFHFYDGFLLACIKDYRHLTGSMRAPSSRHVLLRPTNETIFQDSLLLATEYQDELKQIIDDETKQRKKARLKDAVSSAATPTVANDFALPPLQSDPDAMTDISANTDAAGTLSISEQDEVDRKRFERGALAIESYLLRMSKRNLCLDPSPRVVQVANLLNYNRNRSFVQKLPYEEAEARAIEIMRSVGETEDMMALAQPPPAPLREQYAADFTPETEKPPAPVAVQGVIQAPGLGWYEHEIELPGAIAAGAVPSALQASTATSEEQKAHKEAVSQFLEEKTSIYRLLKKQREVKLKALDTKPAVSPPPQKGGRKRKAAASPARDEPTSAVSAVVASPDGEEEMKDGGIFLSSPVVDWNGIKVEPGFHHLTWDKYSRPTEIVEAKPGAEGAELLQTKEPTSEIDGESITTNKTVTLLNYASFLHFHNQSISNALTNAFMLDNRSSFLSGKIAAINAGVPPHHWGEVGGDPHMKGMPVSQPFVAPSVASTIANPAIPLAPPPPPPNQQPPPPPPNPNKKNSIHISSSFVKIAPADRQVRRTVPRPDEWTLYTFLPPPIPPGTPVAAQHKSLKQAHELLIHALPVLQPTVLPPTVPPTPVFSGLFEAFVRVWTLGDPRSPEVNHFKLGNEEAAMAFVGQFRKLQEKDNRALHMPTASVISHSMPSNHAITEWAKDMAAAAAASSSSSISSGARSMPPGATSGKMPPGPGISSSSTGGVPPAGYHPSQAGSYNKSAGPYPPSSSGGQNGPQVPSSSAASANAPGANYPPNASRGVYPATSTLPPNTMPNRSAMPPSTGASSGGVGSTSGGGANYRPSSTGGPPPPSSSGQNYSNYPQQGSSSNGPSGGSSSGGYPSSNPSNADYNQGRSAPPQQQPGGSAGGNYNPGSSGNYPSQQQPSSSSGGMNYQGGSGSSGQRPSQPMMSSGQQQQQQQQQQQMRYSNAPPSASPNTAGMSRNLPPGSGQNYPSSNQGYSSSGGNMPQQQQQQQSSQSGQNRYGPSSSGGGGYSTNPSSGNYNPSSQGGGSNYPSSSSGGGSGGYAQQGRPNYPSNNPSGGSGNYQSSSGGGSGYSMQGSQQQQSGGQQQRYAPSGSGNNPQQQQMQSSGSQQQRSYAPGPGSSSNNPAAYGNYPQNQQQQQQQQQRSSTGQNYSNMPPQQQQQRPSSSGMGYPGNQQGGQQQQSQGNYQNMPNKMQQHIPSQQQQQQQQQQMMGNQQHGGR